MMGLLWGIAGAVGGGIIELVLNILPGSDLWLGVDIWPAALAIPGFISGVLFSGVIALAERRRRFEELSLARISFWGALTGAILGVATGAPLIILGPLIVISGASAATSLGIARWGAKRDAIGAGTTDER